MCHGAFPVCHLVRNYTHNLKTKGGVGRVTYLPIALLSEISILLVRAVREICLVSYEFKHGIQLVFNTTFCAYLHS